MRTNDEITKGIYGVVAIHVSEIHEFMDEARNDGMKEGYRQGRIDRR